MTKKALVVGLGISGMGAGKLLSETGYEVYAFDDVKTERKFSFPCVDLSGGEPFEVVSGKDVVVVSPGIGRDHPVVTCAERFRIEVIGEVELGYRNCKNDIVAVTGTNGKTTTVTLLEKVLDDAGIGAVALGNIGRSFCSELSDIEASEVVVLEVSSFQLETTKTFAPKIAVCLNVTPDHYERHGTFEQYAAMKRKLFINQRADDIAILNYDDVTVRDFCTATAADKYYFSLRGSVKGTYVNDGVIYFRKTECGSREAVCRTDELPRLKGVHNLYNVLACVTVAKLLGISNTCITESLASYAPPRFRTEFVGKIGDKSYFNDSKATNIDATLMACRSMNGGTALIVGGYDKGICYDGFFSQLPPTIKHIVGCGDNVHEIMQSLPAYRDYTFEVTASLERAVRLAAEKDVENVLFSPTTSSFDRYDSYIKRGEHFDAVIGELWNEEKGD